jgi:NAD(P)-dependent dehydrogenase (short-subunit alcohol dehydrogenase family)
MKGEAPTIIITGASKGLGAAMAYIAAGRGAQVVLAARSAAALATVQQRIQERGGSVLAVVADVTKADDCRSIVDQALQMYGKIHALVNNAATIEPLDAVADVRLEDWTRHMAVNVFGPLAMSQFAIPHLRRTRGRIVNVTSHGAATAIPGASAYSASKAALNRLSKTLAAEEPDIPVLLLVPGEVDTAMQAVIRDKGKGKTSDEIYQFFLDQHEQGRLLPPETPALAGVALALKAPHAWSGELLEWDDDRVQDLIRSL